MIRQRFGSGRLTRIAAWALAAVTAMAAILNNQLAEADETTGAPTDEPPVGRFAATAVTIPAAPADGLRILRYQPTPPPLPATTVGRTVVDERVSGPTSSAVAPASPPPPPTRLPAPPPLQSSGS